jgi:hypothetical protein
MENAMKWVGRVVSVTAAVLLSVMATYADDDAGGSPSDTHTIVVQSQGGVSWYEITVSSGVPQQVVSFDSTGTELARAVNPVVSGQGDGWCPLIREAVAQCDACGEVAANSGCGQ